MRLNIAIYEHHAQQQPKRKARSKADKERIHIEERGSVQHLYGKTTTHILDSGIDMPHLPSIFAVSVRGLAPTGVSHERGITDVSGLPGMIVHRSERTGKAVQCAAVPHLRCA